MENEMPKELAETLGIQERMPGKTPWTVSVDVFPGEEPCPELQQLDQALRKDRGWRDGDNLIEQWKSLIKWPPLKGRARFMINGEPIGYATGPGDDDIEYIPICDLHSSWADWEQWLIEQFYSRPK
jgi:hypothetical protein